MALNMQYNKNKLYKTDHYWSWNVLNFNFPEKGLKLASPPHFLFDFFKKLLTMLFSIKWQKFIAWWTLLLEILGNIYNTIVC